MEKLDEIQKNLLAAIDQIDDRNPDSARDYIYEALTLLKEVQP